MNNIINVKIPRRDYDTIVIARKHGRVHGFEFTKDEVIGKIGEKIITQIYEQLGFKFVEYNEDKNKENLKLKLQRKRENQEMISVKRRIRGKLYNLLTTNTLFVCDDLVQKLVNIILNKGRF